MARQRIRLTGFGRLLLWAGLGILGVAVVVGIVALLLGPAATWTGGSTVQQLTGKERADAINAVRRTLLQAAAGAVALSVLAFTAMTYLLNRRGQVTDRYARAVEMLASDKRAERIGGIYALEHVMIESRRDHDTVVQVLTAFIRENATASAMTASGPQPGPEDDQSGEPIEPSADIQAALTVLGRRPLRGEAQPLDLRRTDLRGAELVLAELQGADLTETRLENANLVGAYLNGAKLVSARLEGANLMLAHLNSVDLTGTHLERADLRTAFGLTQSQIDRAVVNAETRLSLPDWSELEGSASQLDAVAVTEVGDGRRHTRRHDDGDVVR